MGDVVLLSSESVEPYALYKADSGALTFSAKCRGQGAIVILLHKYYPHNPVLEAILCNASTLKESGNRNIARVNTPDIISTDVFSNLWLTWYGNRVCVGRVGAKEPFIELKTADKKTVIGYVKFVTKYNSEPVEWRFEGAPALPVLKDIKLDDGKPIWVNMNAGDELPINAFVGGQEYGEPVYIARSEHEGSLTPGKYIRSRGHAIIGWNKEEHIKESFEILCGYDMQWVRGSYDNIPPVGAVVGGRSELDTQNRIYIVRAHIDGNIIVGKKHDGDNVCYYPYNGIEARNEDHFEVLFMKPDCSIGLINSI